MNTALWWLVQNTIAVSVMIPLVAVSCRLFRNRPAVQHMLWAIVLLKFVTPPIVVWPWSVPLVSQPSRSSAVAEVDWSLAASDRQAPASAVADASQVDESAADENRELALGAWAGSETHMTRMRAAETTGAPIDDAVEVPEFARIALGLALGSWIAGGVACALRLLQRITQHLALIRRGSTPPPQLRAEVEIIANQLGLRPPRTVIARGVLSPFMWFFGRLRLVWPDTMTGRDAIVRARGVIAHELAHVRRGDHWLAWLDLVAGVVWWWNPLFWFVRKRLRESAEMACDAIALSTCPENRRGYAELLLELSASSITAAPVLAVSAGAFSSFERRLSMILSDRVSGKASAWGFFLAGCLAVVALPGWSVGQQDPSPKDRQAISPGVAQAAAPSDDGAVQSKRDSKSVEERLRKLEDDIQTIVRLLEQRQRAQPLLPKITQSGSRRLMLNQDKSSDSAPYSADSQSARLERLEKAVDELRQRLHEPTLRRQVQFTSAVEVERAVAEFNATRDRARRLTATKDTVSKLQFDEIYFELQKTEKELRLLSDRIKETVKAAQAAHATARDDFERALSLSASGYLAKSELDAARARKNDTEAWLKQLDAIVKSLATSPPPDNQAPRPRDRQSDPRPQRSDTTPEKSLTPVKSGSLIITVEPTEPAVLALDLATGKIMWKASLKGAQLLSITVDGDMLLIPTADGSIKKLEAKSGKVKQ